MMPTVKKECEVNKLGVQLAALRKERYGYLSRIDSIGVEMRETVGLIAEIVECKLKVLEDLLTLPIEERDFEKANREFQILLSDMKKENLQCYQSLLDAREGLMEAGQCVVLTKDKKLELMTSFAALIDEKIINENLIADTVDLEDLKAKTRIQLKSQIATYGHLLDSKTNVATQMIGVEHAHKQTKEFQKQLISQNEVVNIWQASECGDFQFIQAGIKELWWFQVEDFVNQKNHDGITPLILASAYGHLDCVKLLLSNKAKPKIADALKYQPLHWAAKKGHIEIGTQLCHHNADINARGEYGRTPLHMAAHNGQVDFVELLLKQGADINAQADKEDGNVTALHEAIMKEDEATMIALTKRPELNVNLVDAKNHPPLYYAVLTGRSDLAAMITGHLSWKCPKDLNDPNHIIQLLKLKPTRNSEQIKKFLGSYLT